MAEAVVEQRQNRFFCHQCSVEISPNLPDYTCPRCESGFIEEMIEEMQDPVEAAADPNDPAVQFAELWGRTLMDSFRLHTGQPSAEDEEMSSDSETENTDEAGPASRTRSRQHAFNPFMPTRARIHLGGRRNNAAVPPIDSIVQQVLAGLTGGAMFGGRGGGIPIAFNLGGLYGNPGDYAWGSGGLDAIITQLLNQLDGSGPPPAPKEKINELPTVEIVQEQVDKNVQCSVCMDDFKCGESVRKLPCNHYYHNDCIVPWLELHGTCPVCRKTLDGKDTSTDEATPADESNEPGTSSDAHNRPSTSSSHSSTHRSSRSNNHDCLDEYD